MYIQSFMSEGEDTYLSFLASYVIFHVSANVSTPLMYSLGMGPSISYVDRKGSKNY